jgi:hypothetical protein
MARLTKKLRKWSVGLHPGEEILAAMVLHPNGMARRVAMGPGIGHAMEKRARKEDEPMVSDRGTAATLPQGPAVIAVTPGRYVVYEMSGLRPRDVVVSLSRDQIVRLEIGKDKIGPPVRIDFADGTSRMFETPMRNTDVRDFLSSAGA